MDGDDFNLLNRTNERTNKRDGTGSDKALCFAFTTIDGSMVIAIAVSGGKVKPR